MPTNLHHDVTKFRENRFKVGEEKKTKRGFWQSLFTTKWTKTDNKR